MTKESTPSAGGVASPPEQNFRGPQIRRTWSASLLLGLVCLLVYNANLRCINAGDTLAARYLPFGIWRHGTVTLEPIGDLVAHGHPSPATWTRPPGPATPGVLNEPWAYWIIRGRDDVLVSLYPIVAPVLVAPLYLPAVAYLREQGWQLWQVDWVAALMEKLSASLLATITVLVMYRLLRRHDGDAGDSAGAGRSNLALILAFAFGTNTWMIASQALWQHGAGELLVALALLLVTSSVTSRPGPPRWAALGAISVAMAANRPPDALLAAAMVTYAVLQAGRAGAGRQTAGRVEAGSGAAGLSVARPGQARPSEPGRRRSGLAGAGRVIAWVAAGAVVPLALVLAYNLGVAGSFAGGYGTVESPGFFEHSIPAGLAGLLVSPARGLLAFSPFLLFVPLGLVRRLRSPHRLLAALLLTAVLAQLVLYAMTDWRQGFSWGPRWLTDVLPILVWMLAPAALLLRPAARGLLWATIVASIAIQTIGAFWYTGSSDRFLYASGSPMPGDWIPAAWKLDNAPFVAALRDGRPPRDLACSARGHLDLVGSATAAEGPDVPAPVIGPGMLLRGWALVCGRTPDHVLLLAGGRVIGKAEQFSPSRPDVVAAMGSTAPSEWRVEADTLGLAAGEHVLQVAVRAGKGTDIRIVSESRVVVPPDAVAPATPAGLAVLARTAAARIREHQSSTGYWLTTFTTGTRFESPGQEMNTFLTATLVDLVAPVAKDHALEAALEKARRHLTAQIEANGLVRYHGLPDGPGMGVLGCPITPDADDTALVWRIAPPPAGDARRGALPGMLRVLESYRDGRGFYRTWLAPQERYQCIDPGRDPNPADVTIQMNVLLMLDRTDPAAARSLCQVLTRNLGDQSLWVYYARAPLVPLLRTVDLRNVGCVAEIPGERLAAVAGQERWMAVARALVTPAPADARSPAGSAAIPPRRTLPALPGIDVPSGLALLAELARDDFAELRRTPPLLYHNDLSASVSRYYWSEDVGYALWLRLYEEVHAASGGFSRPAPRARSS